MRKETRIIKILPTNQVHNMSLNRSIAAKKNPRDKNREGIACDSNDYCSWVVGGREGTLTRWRIIVSTGSPELESVTSDNLKNDDSDSCHESAYVASCYSC